MPANACTVENVVNRTSAGLSDVIVWEVIHDGLVNQGVLHQPLTVAAMTPVRKIIRVYVKKVGPFPGVPSALLEGPDGSCAPNRCSALQATPARSLEKGAGVPTHLARLGRLSGL